MKKGSEFIHIRKGMFRPWIWRNKPFKRTHERSFVISYYERMRKKGCLDEFKGKKEPGIKGRLAMQM